MAKKFSELPSAGALQDPDVFAISQSGSSSKYSGAQLKALIDSLIAEFANLLGTASAYNYEDFATAAQGLLAGSALQAADLAPVAFSGNYSDLAGRPSQLVHKLDAVTAPGAANDSSEGYTPLSCWLLPDRKELWMCVSAAAGAAVWIKSSQTVRSGDDSSLVIGLRRPASTTGPAGWERIRADGSGMSDSPQVYFANHPTYSAIQTVLVDGQYMVKIPKFWYRINTLAGGGVEYLVSPEPRAGFVVHPAFFNAGNEINQFWIGSYHACDDPAAPGVKLGSQPNINPQASLPGQTGIDRMQARNGSGIAGFGSMTWHQICAVKLLSLIEIGTPDVRTIVGQGWNSSTAGAARPAGTSDANWRGVYDLWGLLHTLCTGIEIVGARIWVADESGALVDTGLDQPTSGYISTVAEGAFGWAFLPASTGASSTGYMAYQWANNSATTAVRHGGAFSHAAETVGLFTFSGHYALSVSYSNYGFRLAKV